MQRSGRPWSRWLHAGAAVAALIGTVPILWQIAYPAMFSRFQAYDDEGYLLVSLRSYMSGQALYDDVFTQYGPFHYQLLSGIFRASGGAPTHDDGRLLTLAIWLIAGVVAGIAAYLFTRSVVLAVGSQALAFMAMFTVTNEPLHPGAVLCLLLLGLAGVLALVPAAPRSCWLVAGVLATATILVKINVGGFALIAILVGAIVSSDAPRPARVAAALLPAIVPFALMAGDLGEDGRLSYAFLVASAGAAVGMMGMLRTHRIPWRPTITWLGVGVAVAGGPILLAGLVQGTSIGGLVDGVFLRPLGQGEAFTLPMLLPPGTILWAGIASGAGVLVALLVWRGIVRVPSTVGAVAGILAGLAMWLAVGGLFGSLIPAFSVGIPLAWVAVLSATDRGREARLAIAVLAVLASLHAYPVAGSQTSWSGLLLAPLGALAIGDGIRTLSEGRNPARRALVVGTGLLPAVLMLALVARGPMTSLFHNVRVGYLVWSTTDLSGAERLRFNRRDARTYTRVTAALREHCRTFYSWPGMNSFYLFAQQAPPTPLNATSWSTLFDDGLQARVVEDLQRSDGLCLLRNPGISSFWLQGRQHPGGPLVAFLEREFEPRLTVRDFELLVRRT